MPINKTIYEGVGFDRPESCRGFLLFLFINVFTTSCGSDDVNSGLSFSVHRENSHLSPIFRFSYASITIK